MTHRQDLRDAAVGRDADFDNIGRSAVARPPARTIRGSTRPRLAPDRSKIERSNTFGEKSC